MSHAPPGAACNKTLQKKWDSMRFTAHRDKVRSIKPTVDTKQPPAFLHIRQKAKKVQMGKEREDQITRHNRELAHRMHHIMLSTGRTDHMNDYKPRSLNYEKRVLEFHKISGENLKTLQRLKSVKPQYSTSMWESEFKEHNNIKKNLSMFPCVSEGAISPRKLRKLPREELSQGLPLQVSTVSDTGSAVQVEEEKIPTPVSP